MDNRDPQTNPEKGAPEPPPSDGALAGFVKVLFILAGVILLVYGTCTLLFIARW